VRSRPRPAPSTPTGTAPNASPDAPRCANACSPPSAAPRLAEVRRQLGITQTQLAEATGLSQARISQIENGASTGLDTLRAYITGLGGHIDMVVRIGNIHLNIA
jgi:DNA-binding XRE family transcriptional regulator